MEYNTFPLPNELIYAIGELDFEVHQTLNLVCKHLHSVMMSIDIESFTIRVNIQGFAPMLCWLKLLPDGRIYEYKFMDSYTPLIRKDKRTYRYVLIYEYFEDNVLYLCNVCSAGSPDITCIYRTVKSYTDGKVTSISRTLNGMLHGEQFKQGRYYKLFTYFNNGINIGNEKRIYDHIGIIDHI